MTQYLPSIGEYWIDIAQTLNLPTHLSYGREDLLAMMGKINIQAPGGLEKCPFFVEKPQTPIVLMPSTEAEMVLNS